MQKYDNQHLLNNKINSWDQYYVIFTSMVSYVMFYICVWKHMCNQHYHVLNSKRFKEVNKKLKKIKKTDKDWSVLIAEISFKRVIYRKIGKTTLHIYTRSLNTDSRHDKWVRCEQAGWDEFGI